MTAMMGEGRMAALKAAAEERLVALLPPVESEPRVLHEAMRYSLLAPGKRLRPVLVMAACEAAGGRAEAALDAACAVEMLHCFSLIHDDLPAIDDDELRRGRPTNHMVYGEGVAILAGDALFALALRVAIGAHPEAGLLLARCAETLVNGETLDVVSEGVTPDLALVETIHRRKTGALIEACGGIGAVMAGAGPEVRTTLEEYGMALGLAFQIADDVLNETADAATLGKAAGSDRERGKLTYPAVMGIEAARAEAERQSAEARARLAGLPGETGLLDWLAVYAVARGH